MSSLIYSLVYANYMQIKYILYILNSSIFKAEFVRDILLVTDTYVTVLQL